MPAARKESRDRSPSPNLRSPASYLSEEAIDLICAHVRNDDKTRVVTQTLRSLALTGRRFLPSATRALWFDPTRSVDSRGSWTGMQLCLETLLVSPHLGNYIRSLRHIPAIYDIVQDEGLGDRDFSVWCWTLLRLAPRIQAVSIMPWSDSDCCKALAGGPHIRDLWLDLPYGTLEDGVFASAQQVFTFLQDCGIRRLRFLRLPWLERDSGDSVYPAVPLTIRVEHIIVEDAYHQTFLSSLHRFIRFEGVRIATYRATEYWALDPDVFRAMSGGPTELVIQPDEDDLPVTARLHTLPSLPRLTTLRLLHVCVLLHDLEALPVKMPALQTLDLVECSWGECKHCDQLWLDLLPSALQLRTVSFTACRPISVDIEYFANLCDIYGVRFTWEPRRRMRRGRPAKVSSDPPDLDLTPLRKSSTPSPSMQEFVAGDTPAAAQTPASGDGDAPYYWVFDEHGRPFAIPYDLADLSFWPPPSDDEGEHYFEESDDDSPEQYADELEYLPAPPDEPRLESAYQAGDPDNEDDSCSTYEPWLDWSDPCDIEAANAAWTAHDINDSGRGKKRNRRRRQEDAGDIDEREAVRAFLAEHEGADYR